MANPIIDILDFIYGVLIGIADNIVHLALVLVFAYFFYKWKWGKKTRDFAHELFMNHWSNATTHFKLESPKTLALCQTIDETLNYQPIGNIIGITAYTTLTDISDLKNLVDSPNQADFDKLLETHRNLIIENKYWLVFALESHGNGIILPKKKQELVLAKPYQVEGGFNSLDGMIRIRGDGITPVSSGYSIITDKVSKINYTQALMDITKYISNEGGMYLYSNLASLLEEALKSDTTTQKSIALEVARYFGGQPKREEAL